MPGPGISITHGQPGAHWLPTDRGLCINLESMWDEFEASVTHFVDTLQVDDTLRERTVTRFRARQWTVQPVTAMVTVHPVMTPNRAFGSHVLAQTFAATAMARPVRPEQ